MSKDLGFGGFSRPAREALDLSGFETPSKASPERIEDHPGSERAAERAGFVSREPTERVIRQRKAKEPTDQIFVRAPISVINRYKTFCNESGMSYGELLEDLMKRSGI